jgi:hypothetical protein
MTLAKKTLALLFAAFIGLGTMAGCHENDDHHGDRDHDEWRAHQAGWHGDRDHDRWDRDRDHDGWRHD